MNVTSWVGWGTWLLRFRLNIYIFHSSGCIEYVQQMKWHKIDTTLFFSAAPASRSFIWLLNIYRGWVWWRRGFNLCGMLIVKSKKLYLTFFFDFFLPPFFFFFGLLWAGGGATFIGKNKFDMFHGLEIGITSSSNVSLGGSSEGMSGTCIDCKHKLESLFNNVEQSWINILQPKSLEARQWQSRQALFPSRQHWRHRWLPPENDMIWCTPS